MTLITDLKRNDVDAAMAFLEEHRLAGTLLDEDLRSLFMLQDDPTELRRRLAEIRAGR